MGLYQNSPNPFNPSTVIQLDLNEDAAISLQVFDLGGRLVRTLVADKMPMGRHKVVWDARDDHSKNVASGVYICRLRAGHFTATRKMVVLK
jgi:hypothetical protein